MSAQPRIRPAEARDLTALVALEEAAFASDQLDRRALRHAIRSPTMLALVAEGGTERELAGYALVQVRRGSTVGRLTSLAIAPAQAGRGLGRLLLERTEDAAREYGCDRMRLEVRADNKPAARLYETARYDALGRVDDYYEDGTAALRFEKRLGDPGTDGFVGAEG